jgi:hypothetical protein
MSFLGKIKNVLSSPSVVEKAADAAINGLDAIWHTPEEKEGDRQKRTAQALQFLELTKGASPARRMIAMVVIGLWAFAGLNILILMNIAFTVEDPATMDAGIKAITDFSIDYVAKPTGLVLAFYFLKNILPSGK